MSVQHTVRELLADSSDASIWTYSVVSGALAVGAAIFVQWLVFNDWLHEAGLLRLAGSALAGLLLGALVFRSQWHAREKRRWMLKRLQAMRWANDRIRNSLQALERVTYPAAPVLTPDVKDAVDTIECILNGLLVTPDREVLRERKEAIELTKSSAA
jgi:hypothetical protein